MAKKKVKRKAKKEDGSYRESKEYHDGLEMDQNDIFEANQDAEINAKMDKIRNRNKLKDVSGGFEEG